MAEFKGDFARIYDVFVDWEGRLGREMPGITSRLRANGAQRVLDCGCGTGRHVAALVAAGFDAHGADASEDMLSQAREFTGQPERFMQWRMGDPPPELEPFDAIVCLGNTFSLVDGVPEALDAFRTLVRPGGLILLGLKAVAIRRETKNPYMPLLRREYEGEPIYFIRFVEFDQERDDTCHFHMLVCSGDGDSKEPKPLIHRAGRARVWSPETLQSVFEEAGFEVRVSGRIDDPDVTPTTEDVFVHATPSL